MSSSTAGTHADHRLAHHADDQAPVLALESRPSQLIAARYDVLPFPNIGPVQEIALDLGITAFNGTIDLLGLVFKGYAEHQLLFEQRWPARIIRRRIGDDDLTIPDRTGLAVRSLQFLIHGYEPLTLFEVEAVGKVVGEGGVRTDAILRVPVEFHEQQTALDFPLEGAWWTIQAADWSDQHKLEVYSQTFAYDFVKLGPDNRAFAGDGLTLEDHYSWGEPVFATAGGKVAHVCYDMPDLTPGTVADPRMFRNEPGRLLGNSVIISHANGEFSCYGHLQQANLQVNQGEIIKRGTLLGYVGNSGNSPGPHLHFHLMEGPNMLIDRGLPARFQHFWAGGQYFDRPIFIPTRMIVIGPAHENVG